MKRTKRYSEGRRKRVSLQRRFIVAKEYEDGYSWTLAAVLGEILLFAEEKFGARDHSYTFLGIDFFWWSGDMVTRQLQTPHCSPGYELFE